MQELLGIFPNSIYHSRKGFPIKAICDSAIRHEYTDLMILHEDGGVLSCAASSLLVFCSTLALGNSHRWHFLQIR